MKVYLNENSEVLDEVVVVGYSTEKKADQTGSVAVVKMKDVSDTPTGNVIQALQGRVAGMTVTTDGTPAAHRPEHPSAVTPHSVRKQADPST